MLEFALQYAARGWPVFAVSGFKIPFKGTHGHLDATTDSSLIRDMWRRHPRANVAMATGNIVVFDADGPGGVEKFKRLREIGEDLGQPLARTLTARTARGYHLFFRSPAGVHIRTRNDPRPQGSDGLDIKAHGGFVVLPPSINARNGFQYKWILELPVAELPLWLANYLQTQQVSSPETLSLGEAPAFLQQRQSDSGKISSGLERAIRTPWTTDEEERIRSALLSIPADCARDTWLQIGMALHGLGWEGNEADRGYEIWREWSATGKVKYQGEHDLETRWKSFGKAGREQVTLGTLYHYAQQHGWQGLAPKAAPAPFKEVMQNSIPDRRGSSLDNATPHSAYDTQGGASLNGFHLPAHITAPTQSDSPLIRLNSQYAVIGDVGGKCLVLGWTPSRLQDGVMVPSFQTFKSFADRYAHEYITIKTRKDEQWEDKTVQLGSHWLKWPQRRTYEAIDMVPNGEPILPGNILNLWKGFAVEPKAGAWPLMKRHIADVLACGDLAAMTYIVRWAAWKVQHPGERAEVALVFRGDKGTGKGTFANAIKRLFGQHGLQIYSSKHLIGHFNAHLRSCLLLYADEAFWAGDKQGESVLMGMLTEPTIVIEQKGIDAAPWTNRLGVIMSTNAEWVVPARQKERRYAVFNVSGKRAGDTKYFEKLYAEINNGGLEAMLHDLLRVDLTNWHPRLFPQTDALQEQKLRSLDSRFEWFEGLLSDGQLLGALPESMAVSFNWLYNDFTESSPGRHCSKTAFGLFLKEQGCIKLHTARGTSWRFLPLAEHRQKWTERFGQWQWSFEGGEWLTKAATL